jgi:hypothetical protein
MTDRRISLTRVVAIHWYGFRQILDVSNDILISGKFGTGKSALLDLTQYVLLGEHWRPNRAAAGNARSRSLVSYCLCATNLYKDGEPHFTRSSGVSLIGLEFTWPLEKGKTEPRRETWGVRIEYSSPTAEPKPTYFLIPERVEWTSLAPNGHLLDEESFRTWIRRDYGREYLFARQKDYLAEMGTPHHLYFDPNQFWKTFPKAIAFEPEENVEKFIREFILEENPLDVRDVKTAVGAYRETQKRLDTQEDEAAYLRRISNFQGELEKASHEAAIYQHSLHALEHRRLTELVERHKNEISNLETKNAEDNAAFETKLKERDSLKQVLNEFVPDADEAQLEQAENDKREIVLDLAGLREAQKTVRERLRNRAFGWANWLKQGGTIKVEELQPLLLLDDELLAALRSTHENEGLNALPQLAEKFNDLFRQIEALLSPLKRQIEADNATLRQLAEDLEKLDRNETPGAFPLFQSIKRKLANSAAQPEQLCRLVEVKPDEEDWRQALELFLGRNRFAVIVSPADYRSALDILKKAPPGREPESLVHPREAAELRAEVRGGSLAEKVDVNHETAGLFARHLLGNVMAVERAEDLDNCERGITRDGILKQAPTRRRLRHLPGFEFTLGREGLKRLKDGTIGRQKELMALRDGRSALVGSVHQWLESGKQACLGDPRLPDRSGELPRIPQLTDKLETLKTKIDLLSTSERVARLKKRNGLQEALEAANIRIGELSKARQGYNQKHKELTEARQSAVEDLNATWLEMEGSRTKMAAGILDAELEAVLKKLLSENEKWTERKDAARDLYSKASERIITERNNRDNERRALANARDADGKLLHPEYQTDFPTEDENNEPWAARLRLLDETEIPKYRALAVERRKDWEKRLQESVLDRMNERLGEAERTVKQLRDYLDRDIGKHRYRISQKRDQALGPLWKLLDSGFEPTDELVKANRSDEVQLALNQLMKAVESSDAQDDRIKRLLDYRFYHRYDLEMILASRPDAPPISLGRSGRNLSGGENQAPFFISMLSAFHRVYDLGPSRAQHIGLVVMDEAFSKLSADGVEDCLELARNFQLQLVLAFPPEKLGVMTPYADTVIMCRKQEERDAAGYVTRIDNVPTLLTTEEVAESLV